MLKMIAPLILVTTFAFNKKSEADIFGKEKPTKYRLTLFDATENDFSMISVVGATFNMEATRASTKECRSPDGQHPRIKKYKAKNIKLKPYTLTFEMTLLGTRESCAYDFGGGTILIVVQSRKTNEKKLLFAAIDRQFRNRVAPASSDLSLKDSNDPMVLGNAFLESMQPVLRILE